MDVSQQHQAIWFRDDELGPDRLTFEATDWDNLDKIQDLVDRMVQEERHSPKNLVVACPLDTRNLRTRVFHLKLCRYSFFKTVSLQLKLVLLSFRSIKLLFSHC